MHWKPSVVIHCNCLEKSKYNSLEFVLIVFLRKKKKEKKRDQNDDRIFILTPYVYEEKEGLNEPSLSSYC